ncbi:hypothetical protein NIES2109_07600 [Nostoc sp. HK-01]|uniref:UrcA family protein n=2 Tax=Nostocales TaxID=1161 RepID=A0A1Z4GKZ8_9CYAN|nr:hypothetical protein [Nostoc cycadae]BAY18165.1 hypothetical protein NIES21_40080 [Anabaenopsis circularis NIES-21]BBD57992.1 hypothetical protein NIES2109_07600 [Nostoc sp. HK-01]GBE93148.1 valyl-tRNA synthase [Nostoc cycadae WK-1]
MKRPFITLAVVVSAIALARPVQAQSAEIAPLTIERNEAATLIIEPITINSSAINASDRAHTLRQIANSIGRVREEKGCKNIKPLEILNDPEAAIKECEKPSNSEPNQRNGEPVDYLKVPRLDSGGVSLTVTQF